MANTVKRDVVEWVKEIMFPISEGNWAVKAALGSRSDTSGDDVESKSVKLEALQTFNVGDNSSGNQVRSRPTAGVAPPVVVPSGVEDMGCSSPVCGFNQETTTVDPKGSGSGIPLTSTSAQGTQDQSGGLDDGDDHIARGEADTIAALGPLELHQVRSLPICTNASLNSVAVLVGCAALPAVNMSKEVPWLVAEDQCETVGGDLGFNGPKVEVELMAEEVVVAARVLPRDFRPPAPGVNFKEWVQVAERSRKGKKKVLNTAVSTSDARRKNLAATSAVLTLHRADEFPPLAELCVGAGSNLGNTAATSSCAPLGILNEEGLNNENLDPNAVNQFSWKELLRSNKPANLGVDLHYVEPTIINGEPCAVFSTEKETTNMMNWKNTLLCYVVGKSPTYYQFLKVVLRLWKPPGGVEVFSRENELFYCRFSCEEDMSRVINDGPWYMEGKLVVVKKFVGATNCEEDMLSCIPICVKLPCLPVQWWSISGVSKVVSTIGHPLYFDVPSASQSRIAYVRCCVEVAMDRTLPELFNCVGGDKVGRRQKIAYDWVPKKCSKCKAFGHLSTDCDKALVMDGLEIQKVAEKRNFKLGGQQLTEPKGKSVTQEQPAMECIDVQGVSAYLKKATGGPSCSINAPLANAFQPLANIEEDEPVITPRSGFNDICSDEKVANVVVENMGATQQVVEEEGDANNENGKSESDGVTCASKDDQSDNPDGAELQIEGNSDSSRNKIAKRKKKRGLLLSDRRAPGPHVTVGVCPWNELS